MERKKADGNIRAELVQHKGATQLALRFDNHPHIRDHLKKLEGVMWSQTHQCFYLLYRPEHVRRLLNHCRGVVWVDMEGLRNRSQLSHQQPTAAKPKAVVPVLAPSITEQIQTIRAYMEQRRYAPATIKNYMSLLKVYCRQTGCVDISALTKGDIEKYNHHLVKEKQS